MLDDENNKHENQNSFQGVLTWFGILPTLLTVSLTVVVVFILFQYMHTEIPEGVTEIWGARILDTALRTNGKVVKRTKILNKPEKFSLICLHIMQNKNVEKKRAYIVY